MGEGRYGQVAAKFWTDEKVRGWDATAKLVALYLLTSPHRNLLGFYVLPLSYAAEDLGISKKKLVAALEKLGRIVEGQEVFHEKNLGENDFCVYDAAASVIFVKNYLDYNPLQNQNQATAAVTKIKELPDTGLFREFHTKLKGLGNRYARVAETVAERFRNQEQEQEQEQEPEKEQEPEQEKERRGKDTRAAAAAPTGTDESLKILDDPVWTRDIRQETSGPDGRQPAGEGPGNGIAGLFEAEMGRPLSPLETEEVRRMAAVSGEGLVAEALRRAVSRANVRLDYVAGILASWNQKGLATPEEVRLHEAAAARASPGSRNKPGKTVGKYADVYVT